MWESHDDAAAIPRVCLLNLNAATKVVQGVRALLLFSYYAYGVGMARPKEGRRSVAHLGEGSEGREKQKSIDNLATNNFGSVAPITHSLIAPSGWTKSQLGPRLCGNIMESQWKMVAGLALRVH